MRSSEKGSGREIGNATSAEKFEERIEETSKREEQLEELERMRRGTKRKQREDGRLNIFWRKNKAFPTQFGGDEETPDQKRHCSFGEVSTTTKYVTDGERIDPKEKSSTA